MAVTCTLVFVVLHQNVMQITLWWEIAWCPHVMMTLLTNGGGPSETDPGHDWECRVTTQRQTDHASDRDQETRPHTPTVCSHVRCWVISWLSMILNILYWGILLRMSGVVLKASQYLARLFQWSKWAPQMDFQKFYNFHIFSDHRPHIKISKEPSSISWYPLWRW